MAYKHPKKLTSYLIQYKKPLTDDMRYQLIKYHKKCNVLFEKYLSVTDFVKHLIQTNPKMYYYFNGCVQNDYDNIRYYLTWVIKAKPIKEYRLASQTELTSAQIFNVTDVKFLVYILRIPENIRNELIKSAIAYNVRVDEYLDHIYPCEKIIKLTNRMILPTVRFNFN